MEDRVHIVAIIVSMAIKGEQLEEERLMWGFVDASGLFRERLFNRVDVWLWESH